jgi:hypothetical protein
MSNPTFPTIDLRNLETVTGGALTYGDPTLGDSGLPGDPSDIPRPGEIDGIGGKKKLGPPFLPVPSPTWPIPKRSYTS